MSRAIKFRAWDKKQKKMFYGVSTGTVKIWDENAPLLSHEFGYSEDCIFEQYTGLTDKNGKEIYEGDIIKARDWDGDWGKYRIKWKQSHCAFEAFECRKHWKLNWTLQGFGGIEVIGNVHENPELIGGGE